MENQEFLNKYKNESNWSLEIEGIKLSLLVAIRNQLTNNIIQQIIDWKGDRETTYYDDEGYCRLCDKVFDLFCGKDINCSSAMHGLYKFISDAIVFTAQENKELQLQIKKDKINSLKKEIEMLEKDISPCPVK